MALPDPFASQHSANARWTALGLGALAVLAVAFGGLRGAAPLVALAVGPLVHAALAETPPRPTGERVVGAILVRRSPARVLRRALGGAAAMAAVLLEEAGRAFAERRAPGSSLSLVVLAIGVPALAFVIASGRRVELRVGPRGLASRPALGRRASLAWGDVEELRTEQQRLVLRGRGATIRVDPGLDGIADLAAAVLANVSAAAIDRYPDDPVRPWLASVAARLSERRAPMVRT